MNDETNEPEEGHIPTHLLMLMNELQDHHENEPMRQILIDAVKADPVASKNLNDYLLFAGVNHVIGLHNPSSSFDEAQMEAVLPFTADMITDQSNSYVQHFRNMYPMILAASPDNGLMLLSEVVEKMLTSLARVSLAIGWYSGSQGRDCLFAQFHEQYDTTSIKEDADKLEALALARLDQIRELKEQFLSSDESDNA